MRKIEEFSHLFEGKRAEGAKFLDVFTPIHRDFERNFRPPEAKILRFCTKIVDFLVIFENCREILENFEIL